MGRAQTLYREGGTCLIRNDQNVPPGDPHYHRHFTDINGDEAVRLIEQFAAEDKPFLVNVWLNDTHATLDPDEAQQLRREFEQEPEALRRQVLAPWRKPLVMRSVCLSFTICPSIP